MPVLISEIKLVHGADHTQFVAFGDMGVDHCCRDIGVSKEFLDSPDIIAAFNKMGGKAVAFMPISA